MKKKKWLSNKLGRAVVALAKKSAVMEANTSCPYLHYQPKEPIEVHKLRKF